MDSKSKKKIEETLEITLDRVKCSPDSISDSEVKLVDALMDAQTENDKNDIQLKSLDIEASKIEVEKMKITADLEAHKAESRAKIVTACTDVGKTGIQLGIAGMLLGAILKFEEKGTVTSKILQPVLRLLVR